MSVEGDENINVKKNPETLAKEEASGDYENIWMHHKVKHLVRRTKDYIVHVSAETERLDWGTSATYDAEVSSAEGYDRQKHNAVLAEVAVLEARPCAGLSSNIERDFRVLLGEAVVCSLEHDYEVANRMIAAAGQYIEARSQEKSRFWYLTACLIAAGPCVAFASFLWIFRSCATYLLGEVVFLTLLCAMAGAVGALFSVILRTGRLHFDCASGKSLHMLEGSSRIMAGAISGLVVALAMKSGLFLSALTQIDRFAYVVVFLSLVSGAGERFVVSIIEKFDADKFETKDK